MALALAVASAAEDEGLKARCTELVAQTHCFLHFPSILRIITCLTILRFENLNLARELLVPVLHGLQLLGQVQVSFLGFIKLPSQLGYIVGAIISITAC